MERAIVIGNGLSAAALVDKLVELGVYVELIKCSETNLCSDYKIDGTNQYVSKYGPHIFHTSSKEIWNWICSKTEMVPYINSPLAKYNNKFYALPINMNTFQQVFGLSTREEVLQKLDEERSEACKLIDLGITNAEIVCKSVVGETIYNMFFKTYTEKQWKCPVKDLPSETLARVKTRTSFNNNYFNDLYQGLPLTGYSKLINKLLSQADLLTCQDIDFTRWLLKQTDAKIFICNAPDEALGFEFGVIPYLSTRFLTTRNHYDASVVNINDNSDEATRQTNYKYLWPNDLDRQHFSIKEIPLGPRTSLIIGPDFEEARCYPARDTEVYNKYKDFAEKNGWILCGRLAENKYLDMDKAVQNAWSKAECIYKKEDIK